MAKHCSSCKMLYLAALPGMCIQQLPIQRPVHCAEAVMYGLIFCCL